MLRSGSEQQSRSDQSVCERTAETEGDAADRVGSLVRGSEDQKSETKYSEPEGHDRDRIGQRDQAKCDCSAR